jgi:hypothetical protein
VFGVLEQLHKVPPPWIPIALGAVAIVGVIADYLWEQRSVANDETAPRVKQKQEGGRTSTNNQAARDIKINQPPRSDRQ